MLFTSAELSKPKRIQGALVTDDEIHRVVDYIKSHSEPVTYDDTITERQVGALYLSHGGGDDDDPLLLDAKDIIGRAGKASASLLQRHLKVGYARAARILDILEGQGFIGPSDGAKPREILMRQDEAGFDSDSADDSVEPEI